MNGWMLIGESGDVFDALRANHRLLLDAEVRQLALIAQACDEYTVDETRADAAAERLIVGGSPGTACVGEFLALELAGLLEMTPAAAALRIRETLDLRDRHPELWAHVHTGAIAPWQALKVSSQCNAAGLSAEAARWVDHQLGLGLAALPWARIVRSLEGLIIKADTALAARRAREQRADRRVFIGNHAEGGTDLFARLDTADALTLDETISDLANALAACGNTEPITQRRATALGILADPQAALGLLNGAGDGRPTNRAATLIVHIAADSVHTNSDLPAGPGVARLEGIGALSIDTLKAFLADSHVTVRPVVDLNTIPPVDAYEVPDRLRQHVLARNPVEAFPYSARPAKGCDLDHTVPYDPEAPPGARQTRADNLGPLSRRVHRAKTARLWKVEQPEQGTFTWTSPHGFRYEVSPEGTRPLGRLQLANPRINSLAS